VPLVLEASNSEEGKKWFKQIVIEGFTDTDGSYLYNLHLSLQRFLPLGVQEKLVMSETPGFAKADTVIVAIHYDVFVHIAGM
ncbi:hypothetical protein MMO01_29800, partial [Escherichia coli]|nr:hypothetical protein [Escherichia coli]